MASERIQRRIERLLDQIEEAADRRDWPGVNRLAEDVRRLDPANSDGLAYLAA
jgi:phage-related protein